MNSSRNDSAVIAIRVLATAILFSGNLDAQTIVGVFELRNELYFNSAYGLTTDGTSLYLSSGSSSSPVAGWVYQFDLDGAIVEATVDSQIKGPKIVVFKYKPRNRYRVKTGHRQRYTRLRISSIVEKSGGKNGS